MKSSRLFTLGVLAVGCLTGAAAAQYYPANAGRPQYPPTQYPATYSPYASPNPYAAYNPYAVYNPYNQYRQVNFHPGYYSNPSPYGYRYPAAAAMMSSMPRSQPVYFLPNTSAQETSASRPEPSTPATPSTPSTPEASPTTPTPAEPMVILDEKDANLPRANPSPPTDPVSRKKPKRDLGGHHAGDHGLHDHGFAHGDPHADGYRPWAPASEKSCGDLHRLYVLGGFIFLQPRWHDNPTYVTRNAPVGGTATTRFNDFNYDWVFTPRLELGFQNEAGFGARFRYMYFYQTAQTNFPSADAATTVSSAAPLGIAQFPGPGDTALVRSGLNFHLADIEAQQEFRWGPWSLRGSAGGRYAYLQQTYDWLEANTAGDTDSLNSFARFSGAGPTIALEMRRVLPSGNLEAYALGRGSLLYGRFFQRADNFAGGALANTGRREEDDFLPIGELEAGLEWSWDLDRYRLFVSAGVFGQVWFGAGNSSDSSPTFNGGLLDPNAQSRRDLGLLGVAVSAGIQF